jgi:hypothetical protein
LPHNAEQRRGWPPPGVGETASGRDSLARQSSGAALLRQSIKCPYARAGAGARGHVGDARVGALERSGPTRGGAQPSSEGTSFEGRVEPSGEADPT